MGWLQRILSPAAGAQPWDDFWYEPAAGASDSGIDVSSETALRTSAVFACVRILAETVGMMPLHLYRRTDDDGRERATDHPLYPILHDRPNHWQTPMEFREMMQAHISLRGNAYALIVPKRGNWLGELWPLHPDRVKVLLTDSGRLVYEYRDRSGMMQRKLQGEILHLRFLSLDGYLGITPIAYARETVGRQMAMEKSNSRFHRNDATPRVALKHPAVMSEDAEKRFLAGWNGTYGGTQNAHKAAVLFEGMDIVQLGMKPEDAQFVESWEAGLSDICRWFGVHPRKIGAKSGDSQTYSNVEQAQIEHVTDTVLPLCTRWEQALARDLLLDSERETYYPEFMLDGLLRADAVARSTLYEKAINNWMTVNEIRARENLSPVEGGDEMKKPEPAPRPAAPNPANEPDAPGGDPGDQGDQGDEETPA